MSLVIALGFRSAHRAHGGLRYIETVSERPEIAKSFWKVDMRRRSSVDESGKRFNLEAF